MRVVTQQSLHVLTDLLNALVFSNIHTSDPIMPEDQLWVDLVGLDDTPAILCRSTDKKRCVWVVKEHSSANYVLWFGGYNERNGELFNPMPWKNTSALYMTTHDCRLAITAYVKDGILPEHTLPPGHLKHVTGK